MFFRAKKTKLSPEQPPTRTVETQPQQPVAPPDPEQDATPANAHSEQIVAKPNTPDSPEKNAAWFGLGKRLKSLFGAGEKLDADTREELETLLLQADAGVAATGEILDTLTTRLDKGEGALEALEAIIAQRLQAREISLLPGRPDGGLHLMLIIGSNGSGKTTNLAKLAHHYMASGYKPLLAAGDTFRAAAIEQLRHWGDRLGITTIAHKQGGDSAAVIFDAVNAAAARGCDLVLADTAGRLHNKQQLLDELEKIHRTARKAKDNLHLHAVLVLDAATGASAAQMVRMFNKTVPVDGLIVTKLDGSARGGSVLALADELPIAFLGLGERLEDLKPFSARDYARRLLG